MAAGMTTPQPPASLRSVAARAAAKYGVPISVFLRQIQQESGFNPNARSSAGAEGIAQFIPSTAKAYGLTNPFDPAASLDAAARYDSNLIHQYGSVAEALSAYNSGRPEAYKDPNFAGGQTYRYVRSILGGQGQTPTGDTFGAPQSPASGIQGSLAAGVARQAAPAGPSRSQLVQSLLAASSGGDYTGFFQKVAAARQAAQAPAPAPVVSGAPMPVAPGRIRPGDPVVDGTSIGGLHQTEGLPGFPAHDYFAPSGTPVVAPISGKVIRLSGHDPAAGPVEGPHGPLGWSVYIQGSDGHIYYLTHLGSRTARVGETVRAGQPIGTVADYAKYGTPSHVHMGVH